MCFTKKVNIIDYEKAEKEVLLAIEKGVNYFDNTYLYPDNEECLGRILDENKCWAKTHIRGSLAIWMSLLSFGVVAVGVINVGYAKIAVKGTMIAEQEIVL